jgi:type I restriction enzyme, S subunit
MSDLLKNIANYSSDRISLKNISLENYISTENLLQNKKGKNNATNLPPKGEFVTKYEIGDILVSNIRPYLKKIWYANNIGGSSSDVLTIKVNKENNSKFVYYALFRDEFFDYVMAGSKGTKMPRGDKNQVMNFSVPKFDYFSQTQISKILSDLDGKIELNNKINAELEAMAKLIYDYWFVQFDFPNEEGKPYKSSGGKMVWNEKLKREIPEGWEVKEIGKVLRTELGGTPSTKNNEFWDGEFPWLNSGEIVNFPIIDSELKITEDGINNSATTLMPKGTCVLSITRHLRSSILGVDSCANQSVVGIFESEKLKNSYIYPFLVNNIPRLMTLRSGAQQPHINKGTVDDSKIIIPIENILDKYYSFVNSYYDKILNNAFQNKQLSELRDWLLPMLMNGQVKVG